MKTSTGITFNDLRMGLLGCPIIVTNVDGNFVVGKLLSFGKKGDVRFVFLKGANEPTPIYEGTRLMILSKSAF